MKGCSSIHSSITHVCMHASNLRMYNITEWLMTNSICQMFGLFGANGQPSRHLLDPEQMVRASTLPNTRKTSKLHPNCKNTTTLQAEMPSQSIRGRHITICRTTRETAPTTPYITSSQISSTFSTLFVVLNAMFFFKDHCLQSDFSGRLGTESLLRRSVPQGACQRARWISGGLVALHNLRDAAQKVPTEPSYQITPSLYYDPPK